MEFAFGRAGTVALSTHCRALAHGRPGTQCRQHAAPALVCRHLQRGVAIEPGRRDLPARGAMRLPPGAIRGVEGSEMAAGAKAQHQPKNSSCPRRRKCRRRVWQCELTDDSSADAGGQLNGIDQPEFASFVQLRDEAGRKRLRRFFERYLERCAATLGAGVVSDFWTGVGR